MWAHRRLIEKNKLTDADADRWYPSTLCRPNDADFAARAIKQSPGHG